MIRLPQAIASVIFCTLVAGASGGAVGAGIGRYAPSFVVWLRSPMGGAGLNFDPEEFALGLGVVCGLFMGAATGVFLVVAFVIRDAWLATVARRGPATWAKEDSVG